MVVVVEVVDDTVEIVIVVAHMVVVEVVDQVEVHVVETDRVNASTCPNE